MSLNLSNRSTTDIVVLMFSSLVCSVLTITIIGVVIAKLMHPELDFSKTGEAVNNILSTIVGALVGFISGRRLGRREGQQNGESTT
jgi:hypothetical protein